MFVIGVIGSKTPSTQSLSVADELGYQLIENGYFVITGGRGGVMAAVARGGRRSPKHRPGMLLGVVPGYDKRDANRYVDIVITSGLGLARNIIVVSASDYIVAIEGGAGTLSELAFAWELNKPVCTLGFTGGWSRELAGMRLDERDRPSFVDASSVVEAVTMIANHRAQSDGISGVSR